MMDFAIVVELSADGAIHIDREEIAHRLRLSGRLGKARIVHIKILVGHLAAFDRRAASTPASKRVNGNGRLPCTAS